MALVKATDFDALRKLLQRRGKDAEASFVERLSPKHAQMYREVLTFDWLPVEDHASFITDAAEALYPRQSGQLERLGCDMAERTFSGVYRVFLRIPTVPFLMRRAAALWNTFYDTGEARVESTGSGRADLLVSSFPELPNALARTTTGHVQVLLERTGAKEVRVVFSDDNPEEWRWATTWR